MQFTDYIGFDVLDTMYESMYQIMFAFFSFMIISRVISSTLSLGDYNDNNNDSNNNDSNLVTNTIHSWANFLCNLFSRNHRKVAGKNGKHIKIGVLTNELPPIIYGGVSTWVVNFLNMFKSHPLYEPVPIFLAYMDDPPDDFHKKYPGIRIIRHPDDLLDVFKDIDICVNNLWIANETIMDIKWIFPNIPIITVCHSLIKMEHITNLGSQYTNNFPEQEKAFALSDYVVLISHAEEKYYKQFNYHKKYQATPKVIYNMYLPKYGNGNGINDGVNRNSFQVDYESNTIGYIGRHVPRKRPELPIMAVTNVLKDKSLRVYNMGVNQNNEYWRKMHNQYKDQMSVIHFTPDKSAIQSYWNNVGVNCITGIYEPFGYTICETLDRGVPAIVQNLDGPKEIIDEVKENVFLYDVDRDIKKDIHNFSVALQKFLDTPPTVRKDMAKRARKALDKLHPAVIQKDWIQLFETLVF